MSRGRAGGASQVASPRLDGTTALDAALRTTRTRSLLANRVEIEVAERLPSGVDRAITAIVDGWPPGAGLWLGAVTLLDHRPEVFTQAAALYDPRNRRIVVFADEANGAFTLALAPLVLDHELAHAIERHLPDGPEAYTHRWQSARDADAQLTERRWKRTDGIGLIQGGRWITDHAGRTTSESEDFADAFALWFGERRGNPLTADAEGPCFRDLWPARAQLLDSLDEEMSGEPG